MHLYTVLAFAFLFWRREPGASYKLWGDDRVLITLLFALGLPVLATVGAWLACGLIRKRLAAGRCDLSAAQHHAHIVTLVLRFLILTGFAATVFLTPWPDWFMLARRFPAWGPWVQIVGDLVVIAPLFAALVGMWAAAYPLEHELRARSLGGEDHPGVWRFRAYLDFNLRHHVLVVAAPMIIILFAYNVAEGYERALRRWTGVVWAPEGLLGVAACGVFLMAPLMLRRIWHTHSLEPGPLRERLEAMCRRIGLRCRDILVWRSDGMVVNAAVMGILPGVRFVMLSDGLLRMMSPEQVEGVFGHEAGHVRHRHIQHFLLFAFVGWLVASGVMELMMRMAGAAPATMRDASLFAVQGVGLGVTVVFWGLGFGWISRRFERQADLYGAQCVTPSGNDCPAPCSIHLQGVEPAGPIGREQPGRLCATGAALFASALDRVAVLNGIPHEERSWRHSSIESRIRHLYAMAGDPNLARRFNRVVARIKLALIVAGVLGAIAAAGYLTAFEPALLGRKVDISTFRHFDIREQGGDSPLRGRSVAIVSPFTSCPMSSAGIRPPACRNVEVSKCRLFECRNVEVSKCRLFHGVSA